jgi:hypothetical protein
MVILCDTSSILMLLRVSPEMFTDPRFECKTIREVHDEIVQTTKFKSKYPWTREMRDRIKPLVLTDVQKKIESDHFLTIRELLNFGTKNKATDKLFDLSYVDIKVVTHCLTLECSVTSGDKNLVQFLHQEYKDAFSGSISPLEMINGWLEKKLIAWDAEKQRMISDWAILNEPGQPKAAKNRFNELAGYKYAGS